MEQLIILLADTTKSASTGGTVITTSNIVYALITLLLGGSGWIANYIKGKNERLAESEKANQEMRAQAQKEKLDIDKRNNENNINRDETLLKHELETNSEFQRNQTSRIFDKYVELGDFFKEMYGTSIKEINDLIIEELNQGKQIYGMLDTIRREINHGIEKNSREISEIKGILMAMNGHEKVLDTESSINNMDTMVKNLKKNLTELSVIINKMNGKD